MRYDNRYNTRMLLAALALLALCLTVQGCSTNQANVAAKSIITAQEAYDATMSASAAAYKEGIISEDGKADVIRAGAVVHDSIALAQTTLMSVMSYQTAEGDTLLAKALVAMRDNLVDLIDLAVSLGVTITDTIKSYKGE